jgi:hypothetical protein
MADGGNDDSVDAREDHEGTSVAASVSEWTDNHSLTLAATKEK